MPLEKLSEFFRGKKDPVGDGRREGNDPGTTDEMPVLPYKVLYADLPFFTDPDCKNEVRGARIAILRPLDEDGFDTLDIVPTTKTYQPGQYVTWKLNKDQLWEECHFRNPETGKTEQAWTMHVEFMGEVISPKAQSEHRERLEKLEGLYTVSDDTVM